MAVINAPVCESPPLSRRTRSARRGQGSSGPCQQQQPVNLEQEQEGDGHDNGIVVSRRRPRKAAAKARDCEDAAKASTANSDGDAGAANSDEERRRPAKRKTAGKIAASGPTRDLEDGLRSQGFANVAGVDEAGRGPLAGPVVVAACVVPPGVDVPGLHDSKQMSEEQREGAYACIVADARIKWAVSVIDHDQIDRDNILQATLFGMRQAVIQLGGMPGASSSGQQQEGSIPQQGQQGQQGQEANRAQELKCEQSEPGRGDHRAWLPLLPLQQQQQRQPCPVIASACVQGQGGCCPVDYAIVDGNRLPPDLPCEAQAVVKGDGRCVCIAAASVIAKVTRDRLMALYHDMYPVYAFDQNKAYGVPAHLEALRQHGPCPIHRRSFEPVKSMTGWTRLKPLAASSALEGKGKGKGGAEGKGRGKGKSKTKADGTVL